MRYPRVMLLSFCLLTGASAAAYADNDTLDCRRKSLADAVKDVRDRDQTIRFTGVCAGPIVIRTDGLTLKGVGTAIIDGGGGDAVTVNGASRVSLTNIEVRNGVNGIIAVNGAHLTLTRVNVARQLRLRDLPADGVERDPLGCDGEPKRRPRPRPRDRIRRDGDGHLHGVRQWRVRHQRQRQLHHLLAGHRLRQQQCARHPDRHGRQRLHQRLGHRHQCEQQSRHGSDRRLRRPHVVLRRHHQRVRQPGQRRVREFERRPRPGRRVDAQQLQQRGLAS